MSLLKKLVKVLIILAIVYAVARFVVVFKDSLLTGYRAPYLQMLTQDSVIIRWMTENNQLGVVHYGEDKEHISNLEIEPSATKNHSVKISGLKPGTRYFYTVDEISGMQDFGSEKQWFYTHPDEVVPTRVWVIGDSGDAGKVLNQVRDAALNWMRDNPLQAQKAGENSENRAEDLPGNKPLIDVWISLGDIAYRSGTNEQYQAALFDTFAELTQNTSLWPVYGNHDERRWTYFRIFDLPENAEAGGVASGTENYYSLNYSNVHFVMLDSEDSDRSATGDMASWLKKDLAHNEKPWVIVAFHHPPYSKGTHDSDDTSDSGGRMQEMRKNILPILEQAGVDLVLSGHSHMYERSYLIDCTYADSATFVSASIVSTGVNNKHQQYIKPLQPRRHQGAVYVVAGSSSKVDQGPLDHPVHHVGLLEAGSVVIDVDNNKLIARFINNKGQVRDEFSIEKKADYDSSYHGCEF